MNIFTQKYLPVVLVCLLSLGAQAQTPGLLISGFMANPQGSDANKEFVELTATKTINFATTPYSVVFVQGENGAGGWNSGTTASYGFLINTGSISKGQKLYVGGTSIAASYLTGTCNTNTRNTNNSGSTFGTGSSSGVLGNGGDKYDAVGVFDLSTASITATTVPIDAIFYGDGTGPGTANNRFTVPTNDRYNNAQGKFGVGTNTFIAPDPGGDEFVQASGVLDDATNIWSTKRTWTKVTTLPLSCSAASGISFAAANTLSLDINTTTTTSLLQVPDVSGVVADPTDPAATAGIVFDLKENNVNIPAADYTLTGTSNNTSVVTNANIRIEQGNGSATVKIIPTGVGYASLTLTLNKGGATRTYTINYAASAAATGAAPSVFHTGYSDGSAALALDDDYMVVADDERNLLNVYYRNRSGLPVKTFDYSGITGLNLADVSDGAPREIDVEAVARGIARPGRSYWLGSLSNQSTGSFNNRPNRNRLFALDINGTGAATTFTYAGVYQNLKTSLTNWGTTHGLGLSASAAVNKDPKQDDGFNIEGMAFAPDGTTMYIGFRAPLLPVSNRINALIAPIQNFETWFGNAGTTNTPAIDTPILLNLGGRTIRDIGRLNSGLYIILAGDYDDMNAIATVLYRWNGNPLDAPVLLSGFNVNGLNPEGILPVFKSGTMSQDELQLISDNGAVNFYNDGIAAKDLTTGNYKKFRSDFVTSTGTPLPVTFEDFNLYDLQDGQIKVTWHSAVSTNIASFDVERSTDGLLFERVAGLNSDVAANDYSYVDHVCCAPVFFYRIKEILLDGTYYYSAVKMIRMPVNNSPVMVGYNPADARLQITAGDHNELKVVSVRNASGIVVAGMELHGSVGELSLSALPAGLYIVEVRSGTALFRTKVIR
jgi:hypothetical protein